MDTGPDHVEGHGVGTRPFREDDVPFLWDMLLLSIHVREGDPPADRSVLAAPEIAHYLDGFGRPGDDAQVAVDGSGHPVGAAWCRVMGADDPGYGFVAPDVPELGTAVVPSHRGRGIGVRLITELLERHPVMSLSVDLDNVRAERLYARLGFVRVGVVGTAATMVRR